MHFSMNKILTVFVFACLVFNFSARSQPAFVSETFPKGTVFHHNIAYAGDTIKKHQLDIYLPPKMAPNAPLIVWVHGGAWMLNDKYADMGYMTNTLKSFM